MAKMPHSDSGERERVTTKAANHGAPPPEQEQLPCPRCDSTNTKFCYYNNYNFSQPRHFCKSCRRYWTHGGTLRDIPVGGCTRKSAKRSRTNNHSSFTAASANYEAQSLPLSATPVLLPLTANHASSVQFCDVKGNGSFTSLLNNSGQGASGFLALGGFGLGLGHGYEEVGFGLGRGIWPFVGLGVGDVGGAAVNGSGGNAPVTGNGSTWQYESGGESAAFVGGDCFPWPDLAISTPGNGLK